MERALEFDGDGDMNRIPAHDYAAAQDGDYCTRCGFARRTQPMHPKERKENP